METRQNNPKMAVLWQNHPPKGKFSEFYKGSIEHTDRLFCPNFMPICPVIEKNEFSSLYSLQKRAPFRRHFCGTGRQNFKTRFEFGLHMPVKFYPDPLRFAGSYSRKADFEQLHISIRCHTHECHRKWHFSI